MMTDYLNNIDQTIEKFDKTADSIGVDLRLDFADLIIHGLKQKKWSQKELADRVGLKESYISRLIHSNANCTFETVGRILHAFDMRAELSIRKPSHSQAIWDSTEKMVVKIAESKDTQYGKEDYQTDEEQIFIDQYQTEGFGRETSSS
jgi:transcriptional regulator with XRE-family HTH domain